MNALQKVLLGSVVTFQRGYDLPYRDRRHGAFPVVTSAGITDFHSKPMVDPPGVVTGRYGTIGGLFFIDQPFWPLNTTLYVRDFHGNDPRFTYFLLQQFDFESFSGKSGVPGVNRNDLHKEPVWIPASVAEQKEIANALGDVELLLNELNLIIEKKRQIKQAAMQELLTGKRRLPGFEGEWEVKRLKDIIKIPVTDGPHMTPRFLDTGVPFLSVNNLVNNRIDLSDLRFISEEDHCTFSRKCKPQKDDILLGKAASVGKVAIVDGDTEFNIWSPIASVRIAENDSPKFVYYALQSRDLVSQISLLTNASSQGNIGMGDIEKLSFRLPGKEEQTVIASALSEMDAELAGLEARMEKEQKLKQGMMQQLLTGKIRLK